MPYRDIARNSLYLTGGHIASRLLGLLVTALIVRQLAPSNYGDLTLALAYQALFISLVEAGLELTLTRLASQSPDQMGTLVGNAILLRGFLSLVGYLLASLVLIPANYAPQVESLIRLAILILLIFPLSIFRTVYLVTQQMKQLAILETTGNLVNALGVSALLLTGWGSTSKILLIQLGYSALTYTLYFLFARRHFLQPLSFRLNLTICKRLLVETWPLTITSFLAVLHTQLMRLIIGRQLASAEGGYYSLAFNISSNLNAVPMIYFASVYPLLSAYAQRQPERFRWLYRFSFKVMLILALPLGFLASLVGNEIISLYAGAFYLPAVPLFIGLVWIEGLQFSGTALYYTILSAGKQRILPPVAVLLLVLRVGILLATLPWFGAMATIVAGLAMNLAAFIAYSILKSSRSYMRDLADVAFLPFLVVAIVAGVAVQHPPSLVIWLSGIVLYAALLIVYWIQERRGLRQMREVTEHAGAH